MAKYFDPRAVLRQLAKPLLRQFFQQRGELLHLPWDDLKNGRSIDEIYAAWQALPDESRQQVQVFLRDLDQLANDRAMRAFADEVNARAPQLAWQFIACQTRLNKAMWFYLNFPEAFKQATLFALADTLSTGRFAMRRNGLPKEPLEVTPEITEKLQGLLQEHYWPKEMRGEMCRVEHYSRPGGNEYFFAYLYDWPNSRLAFSRKGQLLSKIERYLFSVVFAVCPELGSLDLMARGGRAVQHELQQRFCEAVYGVRIDGVAPERPTYRLQHLLDPNFRYPTLSTDCIRRVRLEQIVLQAPQYGRGLTAITHDFDPNARRRDWLEVINRTLVGHHWSTGDVSVIAAKFELIIAPPGLAPEKKLSFGVELPSWCDLKSKPDEMRVIGERCLDLWEINYA